MRVIFLIIDSLGIGAAPDAERFGDRGANTLGHIAEWCARVEGRHVPLRIPNLERLGLGLACQLASGALPAGLSASPELIGAWAAARELSTGKDTCSGHWELTGVPVLSDWGYFRETTNSFPVELLETLVRRAGLPGCLGNRHASGTAILDELGEAHVASGKPIFYTSADSVFQVACHEETFGLAHLYELCRIAREEVDRYNICRVIARPFVGDRASGFRRTDNRRDLAVPPLAPTVLQKLADAGGHVVGVGKIADIFANVGITQTVKAAGLESLWDATLQAVAETPLPGMVMTNFVDFDQNYGHRRDLSGYAAGLEYFDMRLADCLNLLRDDDVLIVSADHGCDPTWPGSDHTREHVPVLIYGKRVVPGCLGLRESFADVGQSVAHWFGLEPFPNGKAMLAMERNR
jgi:phosphopentomutase